MNRLSQPCEVRLDYCGLDSVYRLFLIGLELLGTTGTVGDSDTDNIMIRVMIAERLEVFSRFSLIGGEEHAGIPLSVLGSLLRDESEAVCTKAVDILLKYTTRMSLEHFDKAFVPVVMKLIESSEHVVHLKSLIPILQKLLSRSRTEAQPEILR